MAASTIFAQLAACATVDDMRVQLDHFQKRGFFSFRTVRKAHEQLLAITCDPVYVLSTRIASLALKEPDALIGSEAVSNLEQIERKLQSAKKDSSVLGLKVSRVIKSELLSCELVLNALMHTDPKKTEAIQVYDFYVPYEITQGFKRQQVRLFKRL